MKELAPIAFIFKFGVCNRFFVSSSYFKHFFSKNFNMTDRHGFLLIDTYKFEELIFANSLCELLVHLFFRNNSWGKQNSVCKILDALILTRSIRLLEVFP